MIAAGVIVTIATGNPTFLIIASVLFIANYVYNNMAEQGPQPAWTRGGFSPGDGPGFERHVQERLARVGYSVRNTGASGDYGADLIATRFGRRIAVQAKNYAKPVGVRAVQEVNAGKVFHKAEEAWVVSRSGFTHQAKALARATGVKLVDVNTL